jgi:hypothetical protein
MARPVALITNFSKTGFPRILAQIEAGPRPPIADWYVGTYGISKPMAEKITAAGFRYAPVFAIQPHTSANVREKRRVRKAEASLLDPAFAGEIPTSGSPAIIPPAKRRAWGIELGQRYRDYMRKQRAAGVPIDTWQFDEILGQCASSAAFRDFVGGILRGLAEGRPELADRPEKGFVWFGFRALSELPSPASSDEVARFWKEVARATLFLVGEEYPFFRGNVTAAARDRAVGHQRLVGGIRELGRKYICAMTPGWKSSPGLRGHVAGTSPEFVTDWRQRFIEARIALQRPRGYGQFSFTRENLRPGERIDDAVASLHFASEQLAS